MVCGARRIEAPSSEPSRRAPSRPHPSFRFSRLARPRGVPQLHDLIPVFPHTVIHPAQGTFPSVHRLWCGVRITLSLTPVGFIDTLRSVILVSTSHIVHPPLLADTPLTALSHDCNVGHTAVRSRPDIWICWKVSGSSVGLQRVPDYHSPQASATRRPSESENLARDVNEVALLM